MQKNMDVSHAFCCFTFLLFAFLPSEIHAVGNAIQLPIGAIFDKSGARIRKAFSFQIASQNKIGNIKYDPPRNLNANSQMTTINDSLSVSRTLCSHFENGVFALYGQHSVRTLNTINAFNQVFHLPYLTSSTPVNDTGRVNGYTLFMQPLYTQALMEIILLYGWSTVYYFYQNEEGLARLEQLYDQISVDDVPLNIRVYKIGNPASVLNTLHYLKMDPQDKKILLDVPVPEAEELFYMLKKEGQTTQTGIHFLLIGLGVGELDLLDYDHGGINITGFQMVDFSNSSAGNRFFEKWTLEREYGNGSRKIPFEAALAADSVSLLYAAFSRLLTPGALLDKNLNRYNQFRNDTALLSCEPLSPNVGTSSAFKPTKFGYGIMAAMRKMDMWGLTGHIAFDKYGFRKGYKLDILEINLSRALAKIGSWSPKRGLYIIQNPTLVRPKGNNTKTNATRYVTSIITEPYLMVKPKVDDGVPIVGNDKYEGYCADLARMLSKSIDIDHFIRPVKDSKYGGVDENGTWNGMVGELIRNTADLAIAPLTITSSRERVIDFSKPFMSLGISIMIKKPEKEVPGVFSFMFPLSYEIWMCVIFAYIGVSVVLFLVSRFSPFEWHIEDNTDGPTVTNNFTIFNSLWFSLGAFMQQGCDIEPRSLSGRFVGSVWWFFTLIIISSYTANLAAFLTVQRMQSPIESADDLAKQTEIKYGSVEGGSTMAFFKTSTINVYARMWAFMSSAEESVFVSSNEDGVRRVRESNGRYAFLTESTTNDYINQRKPCDTMKVGSNLDSKGYGIGTPLGSDLRDRVTLGVLELREKGELQKLEKKWWYDKGECGSEAKGKKKDATSALKLSNVAGIFYILVGGLVLAMVISVLEFLYKSKMEARRRKTSFSNAVLSKARLSIKGKPEAHHTTTSYTYAPAAQLISLDGYADANTHTQV